MTNPVIGICAVRERAHWALWDQEAHLVADSYVAPVQRAGGLAVLLAVDTRAPLELLDRVDGLLLIGGSDIDPATYVALRDPATVRLTRGSLAARAVGEEDHLAHCHHHQAVLSLGEGLVVSGQAEDGVIEAIELADGGWGLGVQWHPEANDRSRLFGALCDAARSHAARSHAARSRAARSHAARDGWPDQRMSKPERPSGSSSRTSTLSTLA